MAKYVKCGICGRPICSTRLCFENRKMTVIGILTVLITLIMFALVAVPIQLPIIQSVLDNDNISTETRLIMAALFPVGAIIIHLNSWCFAGARSDKNED